MIECPRCGRWMVPPKPGVWAVKCTGCNMVFHIPRAEQEAAGSDRPERRAVNERPVRRIASIPTKHRREVRFRVKGRVRFARYIGKLLDISPSGCRAVFDDQVLFFEDACVPLEIILDESMLGDGGTSSRIETIARVAGFNPSSRVASFEFDEKISIEPAPTLYPTD